MPRADWALALALAGLTLATRWPYRARLLPTWDAVQFALALERYDVVRHQPHPPGYILYVALGRLADTVVADPVAALGGLAVLASAVAVLLLYQLGWHLYGRGAAALAALGLAVSPLFWAYSVIGLSYAAEAALATGIAVGAWAMRRGSGRALVCSAVLLGLAGGVRQSMLLILSPLWLGMAWRGFRRPGPVLAGLGLVLITTATWLGPMLWLTGLDRYVAASIELYESTVRATTVLGGGGIRNIVGLGEAFLIGLGVFLPVLAWGVRRAPARLLQDDDRAVFFALWILPALAVYALVHLGQPGYLLTFLPACYLLVGRSLALLVRRERVPRPRWRARTALAGLALAGAFAARGVLHPGGPRRRSEPARGRRVAGAHDGGASRALPIPPLEPHGGRPARAGSRDRRLRGRHPPAVRSSRHRARDGARQSALVSLVSPRHVLPAGVRDVSSPARRRVSWVSCLPRPPEHGGGRGAARAAPRDDPSARLGRRRMARTCHGRPRSRRGPCLTGVRSTCSGSMAVPSITPGISWSP
jgi:4-amino-4-deoxy-L-arabinose transferase-like glycosyltransferase